MLSAIGDSRGVLQMELPRILGVTAATVCRMVRSIEKLGWVERSRTQGCGRKLWVRLTAVGKEVLAQIERGPMGQSLAIIHEALVPGARAARPEEDELDVIWEEECVLKGLLDRLRDAWGDVAQLAYWDPLD